MTDQSVILFSNGLDDTSALYLDNHPATDVPETMAAFFRAEDHSVVSSFEEPEVLAARFVAWFTTHEGTTIAVVDPNALFPLSNHRFRVLCTQSTWPRVATLD